MRTEYLRVSFQLALQIEADRQMREEMELVRQELALEEQEEKNRLHIAEMEMRRHQTREALIRDEKEQKIYREMRLEQERLEEERIIKEVTSGTFRCSVDLHNSSSALYIFT